MRFFRLLLVLTLFSASTLKAQNFEEPNYYRALGIKLSGIDIRGEATATLSNFYLGGDLSAEYSSSFPFNAAWHYFAELGYYFEILQPELEASPNTEFKALAQGINLLGGIRWYFGNEPEFLKIKYDQYGNYSLIPWVALAGGGGMVGASITETESISYNFSEGLQFGYFIDGSLGCDLFTNKQYKFSAFIGLRYYFQDHLDAIIGSGPFPDMIIRTGVGFHYLL